MCPNCSFNILPFCFKCFLFQFLSDGIHIHIPILTGVQSGGTSLQKKLSHFAKKPFFFFFKPYFQDEGDLYANSLFNVLTLYHKCYLFQFLRCDIQMHIPMLTGVQNGCMNLRKKFSFAEKYLLFPQMKVTCMQIDNIIFWLFTIHTFFLSS